ncbi:hypothetical protein DINM_004061 [Dirofilaria immitis]|nr:hypothetical protein [Dirofilaria immitis]
MIRFGKLVDGAIYELNRRSGLLYYHNGKIEPPYIWNYLNQHFQNNSTNHNHQKWSPYRAVLFGNEDPLNITGMIGRGELITVMSQKIILRYNKNGSKIKLAIIITSDSGRTKAYERASMTAQSLRWTTSNMYMPICIVAQSDTRKEKETISTSDRDNVILIFHGSDVKASTFIVDTRDEEILKTKLLKWKINLFFIYCRHLSNIFENVHLSTLRLLDEQSITGINHQDNDKYNFDNGPVYAIIGLKKWIKDEKKYL